MTPNLPSSGTKVYDLPAHMAQPKEGEVIAHEAMDGTLELWGITNVETVQVGEDQVTRCTCFRVHAEPPGVNSYLVSDIAFAQVDRMLADLKSRDVQNPSAEQMLTVIHNVEYPNN